MIVLGVACFVLVLLLGVSVYLLLRIANKVWDLEVSVEECLDLVDEAHQKLDQVAQMPVISDDPMIQQAVSSIAFARNALLNIANKIGIAFGAEVSTDEPSAQDGNPKG